MAQLDRSTAVGVGFQVFEHQLLEAAVALRDTTGLLSGTAATDGDALVEAVGKASTAESEGEEAAAMTAVRAKVTAFQGDFCST